MRHQRSFREDHNEPHSISDRGLRPEMGQVARLLFLFSRGPNGCLARSGSQVLRPLFAVGVAAGAGIERRAARHWHRAPTAFLGPLLSRRRCLRECRDRHEQADRHQRGGKVMNFHRRLPVEVVRSRPPLEVCPSGVLVPVDGHDWWARLTGTAIRWTRQFGRHNLLTISIC
jgi:hypothetical protein